MGKFRAFLQPSWAMKIARQIQRIHYKLPFTMSNRVERFKHVESLGLCTVLALIIQAAKNNYQYGHSALNRMQINLATGLFGCKQNGLEKKESISNEETRVRCPILSLSSLAPVSLCSLTKIAIDHFSFRPQKLSKMWQPHSLISVEATNNRIEAELLSSLLKLLPYLICTYNVRAYHVAIRLIRTVKKI